MSGNGWCTHPDRQVSSDVRILVRKAELACRNAWGSDLWEAANASDVPAAQPTTPNDVQLPAAPMAVSYDDEVTSVVSADEHQAARGTLDDEVVEQSTISFVDDYDYDHEQDERRDLLYRNSRSAIERARERARQRHTPREDRAPVADDDVVISEGDDLAPASAEPPTFAPDDFIEDEAPTSPPAVDEHDDALLSEGIRTPTPRSRRLRRFRDERSAPKEMTATKIEPEPDVVEPELPSSAAPERGRFDSIPEISADIDLPLLRRPSSADAPDLRDAVEPAPESSSYERALKRAHAMNHAARVEQNQHRRRDTPPVAMDTAEDAYGMPDLPVVADEPVGVTAPEPELAMSSGTSAVLHPRMSAERPQPREEQAPRAAQPVSPSRVRAERPARRSPEARQSWWRGGRKNDEHLIESAAADDPEPVEGAAFDDVYQTQDDPFTIATHASPDDAPSFDLRHDEDLASFRARLFTTEQVDGDAEMVDEEPARTPISMSRRERRPLVPPARNRRQAQPDPIEDAPVRADARRRPRPQPQPQPQTRREPSRAPVTETRMEPEMLFAEDLDSWYEPEPVPQFDVRDLINNGDTELLDMKIEIAPDVSKACVTCRSYRPSEQPGRGWCTNTWAFTHRQMVNEHDLACDSTIGCWWLPADEEVWLDEFEVAADATPRVDRLLARRDPERRAVGN